MTAPFPLSVRVVLDHRTRVLRSGGVVRVLGGDPVTLVTPSAAAARLLDDDAFTTCDATSAALARALTDRGLAHPDVTMAATHPGSTTHTGSTTQTGADSPAGRPLTDVTVVVPVKDDQAGVDALVRVLEPELGRGLQVIVVDDGSAVPPDLPAALVHRHPRSLGPAAARNTGTALAVAGGARVVVYLDADALPRPGWLEPLLAHLDDPAVVAVAPRIVAREPGRVWVRGYETARSALDMGPAPARVRPRTRVAYVPSAALAVRPGSLPPVPAGGGAGPFDERLHVAEDVDLCWRIDAAGGRIRYEPTSRVAHRHRTRTAPLLARRAFYGTGAAPLAARHGTAVAPAVAAPWSLAVAVGVWSATPLGLAVAAVALARAWSHTRALTGDGRAAAELVSRGAGASLRQLPEALLRPYWPVTAVVLLATAPSSSRGARGLRRRLAAAAVLEGAWHWWTRREPGWLPADEPVGHLILHRLDDLAYGTGVWRSALAARSWDAIRPELKR